MRGFLLVAVAALALGFSGCSGRSVSEQRKGPGELRYEVKPGDTLESLAQRSGLSTGTIAERNRVFGQLYAGQVLYFPGVSELQAPAAPEIKAPSLSYHLISRAQWGARAPRSNIDPMGGIQRITVHHTSEIPGMATRTEAELVRAVQVAHQDSNGWADLGYHFLIGRDGSVYEGRPLQYQGAHCGGENNRHNVGIALIGDYHHALPPSAQIKALRALMADLMARYGIARAQIQPHRHYGNTVCPGDELALWLARYRAGQDDDSMVAHLTR